MATDIQITCLCGNVYEGGSLLASTLPIRKGLDHCNDCRYTTGAVFHTAASLHGPPSSKTIESCTVYASSEQFWRYFCSTCGTPCFLRNLKKDSWSIGTGLIEPRPGTKIGPDVFIPDWHYFGCDSIDYKMISRLLTIAGQEVPVYHVDGSHPPVGRWEILSVSGHNYDNHATQLQVRCHCGDIDLRIGRPNWDEEIPNIIPPEPFKNRYRASFCVCRSCRLAVGGSSFAPWMYVSPKDIATADGTPVTFALGGTNLAELLDYESTKNRMVRSSCKRCGARVCGWSPGRPGVVIVAVGLLRAREGAAARNWLWWRNEMSFEEEHMDHEMWLALTNDEALQRTQ